MTLRLGEGDIPPKITLLDHGVSYDLGYYWDKQIAGHGFLTAGLSMVGEDGYIVRSVGIYRGIEPDMAKKSFGHIQGWTYFDGHPDPGLNGLSYFDSRKMEPGHDYLAIPRIKYMMAEVNGSLLGESADHRELQEVIDYALSHIVDE